MLALILLSVLAVALGDQCTSHVLTEGSDKGAHGVGCVANGCCKYNVQLGDLCDGDQVCCFTENTCAGSKSSDDECTRHVLTDGSDKGAHGIGCLANGCCKYNVQMDDLCDGDKVCCFTETTCEGADQCTNHVLTSGSHSGAHGIGCVASGCCQYGLEIGSLCAGDQVCCFTANTCGGGSSSGGYNCYGDFMRLHPTGASAQTARQDGISGGGVAASQRMVANDYAELNKRKNCYVQAGRNNCVHPAVIAGIASRETRGGKIIASTGGWGDHHHAYGIMQCDGGASGLGSTCTKYHWDSCEHIDMMVRILLVPYVKTMQSKHSNWAPEQQLQGAVSAYNAGTGNVVTFSGMDLGTTGNDYSNDVMARAQYLVSHYGW